MHEYPPSHPMYRRPKFGLSKADRAALVQAIVLALRRTLGDGHPQIDAFVTSVDGVNDERLVSIATANGAKGTWRELKRTR